VSKNWIKQLHNLPVLHFNRCLTTEDSETTAHFNGNFDIDNQICVPYRTVAKVHSDFPNAQYYVLHILLLIFAFFRVADRISLEGVISHWRQACGRLS
jgi:hypothetical protein